MADLFEQVADNTTQPDENKDYIAELVGDGKKFKDTQALAKSKVIADQHITTLETELAELRNELKQRSNLSETIDQLKSLAKRPEEPSNEGIPDQSERKDVLTPEQLEDLLERKLTERETQKVLKDNQDFVQLELVKRFGSEDIARSEINRKARELSISPEQMRLMAQNTPKVFLALVLEQKQQINTSTPRSSVNVQSTFKPTGPKTKSYWETVKKSDPNLYFSKEASIERHNQAIELGEAFFDI